MRLKYKYSQVTLMPHHWLKHTYVVSNPSTLTSAHDSVGVSGDTSSELTSIEYVRAKLSKGLSAHRAVWVNSILVKPRSMLRLNMVEMSTAE